MNDEFKRLIQRDMEDETERILEEINSSPRLKDVKAPGDVHDALFAQIRAYDEQKAYERLSDEQKELIHLGKVYKKRRKWERIVVVAVALIGLVAYGTVSIGEGENIFSVISRKFTAGEQVTVDSEETEPFLYVDENEAYEEFEKEYGVSLVRLKYLPEDTVFYEASFGKEIQCLSLTYEIDDEARIIYIIRPNYRKGSFSSVVEDEKVQEYEILVNDVKVTLTEYLIKETGENRWFSCFDYNDVQYSLRITNMKQEEVEKIIKGLSFFE